MICSIVWVWWRGFQFPISVNLSFSVNSENGIINPRKETNNESTINGLSQPRKSSLKAAKLVQRRESNESCKNALVSGYANGAFQQSTESIQPSEEPMPLGADEPRRKSVVTFSETTQVIQIAANAGK